MRSNKFLARTLVLCLSFAACIGLASASADLNEVAALLVFPVISAGGNQETFVTITNTGASEVNAHVSFIDGLQFLAPGVPNPRYCFECDFNIPLTPNDTEMLVVTATASGTGLSIESEDGTVSHSCNQVVGMIVVSLTTDCHLCFITDNVLMGSEVLVDYDDGWAFSLPALPFQGKSPVITNREFNFNDVEFARFPRVVAGDFIAPDIGAPPGILAQLILFTLDFEVQHPPRVDCSVTGFDADENDFSSSLLFGCWTAPFLEELSTEFLYPNLGHLPGQNDTHGWFQLNCRTDRNADGVFNATGGVHGAIIQEASTNSPIRRNDPAAPLVSQNATWARLLYQSVTAGDPTALLIGGLF